jgi:hypothetical protein
MGPDYNEIEIENEIRSGPRLAGHARKRGGAGRLGGVRPASVAWGMRPDLAQTF